MTLTPSARFVDKSDGPVKLTTTTGDADDDIIIADKRLLHAIVIHVCFAIGVDFKVQRLNKTDTSDLWRYDARRNGT